MWAHAHDLELFDTCTRSSTLDQRSPVDLNTIDLTELGHRRSLTNIKFSRDSLEIDLVLAYSHH